jgi:serine/threonine-protein phosphatase 2A regulatory subunit B
LGFAGVSISPQINISENATTHSLNLLFLVYQYRYHNHFKVIDVDSGRNVLLHASRDNITGPTHVLQPYTILSGMAKKTSPYQLHVDAMDYNRKIMHLDWHPRRGIMALAAVNNLYLFRQ